MRTSTTASSTAGPTPVDPALAAWIAWAFRRTRRRHLPEGSYALKHRAENQLRRYVSEDEFKAAMLAAGYSPVSAAERHWRFRAAFRQPPEKYALPV